MATLDAIFAASVAQHRDRVAIDVPAGPGRPAACVTYAELDARAEGVRAAIDRAMGAGATKPLADRQIVVVVLPREGVEVYAAQLGIVRGGRAWCCLDPVHPDGYLASVIASVAPVLVITDHRHADRLRGVAGSIPVLDAQTIEAKVDGEPPCASPDGLAYVISTSGTTGAPKGVMVRHASITALVEADRARFGLGPGDRVAQCSSNAYDSSIEETWMALAVGATLVPVDDEVVRSGPDLPSWLRAQRITAFCPPPTLLRAMGVEDPARALPALRLVYVGGEPLPQEVSDLWSAALWLENGYGPTECTVTCTRGRMQPGVPVHLGDAVPGSRAIIVREDGAETSDGEEGELWMAGQCLADGYLRQPALTDERFVVDPRHGRVYRTGDLVRRSQGAIEYLGRVDAQVKVRGHRVELGAVEACLARAPGVREAACALVGEGSGARLAGVVVGEAVDLDEVLECARRALPPAMVPAFLRVASSLPRMVSGKIDRRAVASLLADEGVDTQRWDDQARDPARPMVERVAACAAAAVSAGDLPTAGAHFFADLGGDSLRAVDLVLRIRRSIGLEATVRMVYDEPTIGGLAKRVLSAVAAERAVSHAVVRVPMRRKLTAWSVQGASLGLGAVLAGTVGAWLAFRGVPVAVESVGLIGAAMMAPVAWGMARLAWFPASIMCTLIAKRVLIGRYEPGWVPAWSSRHVREWIVEQVGGTIPWSIAEGTALTAWGLRRLGARVGRDVHMHRGVNVLRSGWDLLALGDGVTLCQDAAVLVSRIDCGGVEHGRVAIGDGATIGVRATVEPGVMIGDGAELAPLTTVRAGASVPAGVRWDGVPGGVAGPAAGGVAVVRDDLGPTGHAAALLTARAMSQLATGVIAAGSCIVVEFALGGALSAWLRSPTGSWSLLAAACGAAALAVPLWLLAAAMALRCTGAIKPGVHAMHGMTALRIWWRTGVVESAGRWISGTLFWPMWLRLAGMRIGRDTEVSSIIDCLPESVSIGQGCFFADGIYFASPEWSRGTVTVATTSLGDETFVGNHAVVPAGVAYPHRMFVGVSTVAPSGSKDGDGWFGVPPMRLSRRDVVIVDRSLTHDPGVLQRINRWSWESARCLAVVPAVVGGAVWLEVAARGSGDLSAMALWGTIASLAAWTWLVVFGLAAKWILLGRVQPGQHGLWSCWCSRWDYLYVLWWFSARVALARVNGTPILAWCLRAAGTRIGRDVMLGPGATQIVDPDMLSYGDRSAIACYPQAHTFEDRVLKIDRVRVDDDASAGENAVTFYGSVIEAGARLEPGSVLMKSGVVAAGTVACGAPVG